MIDNKLYPKEETMLLLRKAERETSSFTESIQRLCYLVVEKALSKDITSTETLKK